MTRRRLDTLCVLGALLASGVLTAGRARAQESDWQDAPAEDAAPADMSFEAEEPASESGASEPAASSDADAEAGFDAEAAGQGAADDATASDAVEAAATEAELSEAPQRALALYMAAGLGVGTLSFERPAGASSQLLEETPFAAAELNLRVHAWPKHALSLDVQLAYQSSFGLALQTDPLFGLPENVDVRWQRGELSAAPVVRLGSSARSLVLAFPIGFAFQALTTEVHAFTVEGYTLGGPVARAELRLPLGELVRLHAGPELQWIVLLDPSLRREGACCQGFAAGMQALLEARVGPVFRAALAYREAHAFVPGGAWRFKEVERFLTARIAGEL